MPKMTRYEILDAASEILAMEDDIKIYPYSAEEIDLQITMAVGTIELVKSKINFPDAEYERVID